MGLVRKRNGRNFGYGRQLSYAGPLALKDKFGGRHDSTVKAHADRWQAFVKWCRPEDGPRVNDARWILADYAAYVRGQVERGELAVIIRQNRISSVNRTKDQGLADQTQIQISQELGMVGLM